MKDNQIYIKIGTKFDTTGLQTQITEGIEKIQEKVSKSKQNKIHIATTPHIDKDTFTTQIQNQITEAVNELKLEPLNISLDLGFNKLKNLDFTNNVKEIKDFVSSLNKLKISEQGSKFIGHTQNLSNSLTELQHSLAKLTGETGLNQLTTLTTNINNANFDNASLSQTVENYEKLQNTIAKLTPSDSASGVNLKVNDETISSQLEKLLTQAKELLTTLEKIGTLNVNLNNSANVSTNGFSETQVSELLSKATQQKRFIAQTYNTKSMKSNLESITSKYSQLGENSVDFSKLTSLTQKVEQATALTTKVKKETTNIITTVEKGIDSVEKFNKVNDRMTNLLSHTKELDDLNKEITNEFSKQNKELDKQLLKQQTQQQALQRQVEYQTKKVFGEGGELSYNQTKLGNMTEQLTKVKIRSPIKEDVNSANDLLLKIEALQGKLSELSTTKIDNNFDFTDSKNIKKIEEFAGKIKEYHTVVTDINKIQREASLLSNQTSTKVATRQSEVNLNNLKSQLSDYLNKNTKLFQNEDFAKRAIELSDNILRVSPESLTESGKSVTELRRQVSDFKKDVAGAGLEVDDFGKKLTKAFTNHIGQAIVLGGINLVRQSLREMVANVKELDNAMVELKKVTDETDSVYRSFLNNAVEKSEQLGVGLSNYVNATADFARLGYNLKDAQEMAESATVFMNVGDGISDISTASEAIISAYKAFGSELTSSMEIVDKFNEVGNNFAISSVGVSEALKRSASALSMAGNSIDESIGLIVGGNAVVQDPEAVGTALKTMSLRLRSTKGELEALGEETDGAAESVTKLQTQLLNLTKGKVNIIDDNDPTKFKSTYQILVDMSKVWNEMTDVEQATAEELMFGKRSANVGASIIQNINDVVKAMETSQNSEGSALRENEKYLDSITGKTQQFETAFQSLSSTVVDDKAIKTLIDFGTDFIKLLDKGITDLGLFKTALVAIGGILSATSNIGLFKTKQATDNSTFFKQVFSGIGGYGGAISKEVKDTIKDLGSGNYITGSSDISLLNYIKDMKQTRLKNVEKQSGALKEISDLFNNNSMFDVDQVVKMEEFGVQYDKLTERNKKLADEFINTSKSSKTASNAFLNASKSVGLLSAKSKIATITTQALSAAFNMVVSLGIGFAIEGLIKLIDNYIKKADNAKEKFSELVEEEQKSNDELSEKQKKLDELQDKIDKLNAKGVSFSDDGESIDNLKSQLEIQKEILKTQEDINQAKSKGVTESQKEEEAEKFLSGRRFVDYKTGETNNNLFSQMAGNTTSIKDILRFANDEKSLSLLGGKLPQSYIVALTEYKKDLLEIYQNLDSNSSIGKEYKSVIDQITSALNKQNNELQETNDLTKSNSDNIVSFIDNLKDVNDTLVTISSTKDTLGEILSQIETDGSISASSMDKILNNEDFNGLDGFKDYVKVLSDTTAGTEEYHNALNGLYSAYINNKNILDNVTEENLGYVTSQLTALGVTNAQEVANSALLQTLIQQSAIDGELTTQEEQMLSLKLKEFNFTSEMSDTIMTQANIYTEAQKQMVNAISWGTKQKLVQMNIELSAIKSLADARKALMNQITGGQVADNWLFGSSNEQLIKMMVNNGKMTEQQAREVIAYGKMADEVAKAQNDLKALLNANIETNVTPKDSNSSSSSDKNKDEFEKWLNDLKHKLETNQITQQEYLQRLDKLYRKHFADLTKYQQEWWQYNEEVYNGLKALYKADLEAKKKSLEEQKTKTEEFYNKQKELLEKQRKSENYEKELSDKKKAVRELSLQIKILEKDTSAKAQKKIRELQQELKNAQEELRDYADEHAYNSQLEYLDTQSKDAQDAITKQIEAIDKQIEALDKNTENVIAIRNIIGQWANKMYGINAYANGTNSSVGGYAITQEKGAELVAQNTSKGAFTFMMPKSMVFKNKATEFLYKMANNPDMMFKTQMNKLLPNISQSVPRVNNINNTPISINSDIIIQGSVGQNELSQIKSAQRKQMYNIVNEFNKLCK